MVDVQCRLAGDEDFAFLTTMLGESAVWRPDKPTTTGDQVLADPRYALYLAGWPRQGDYGLVAEQDGPVGAAWYRTYTEANHGYGFVAEDVPELSIAVIASRRHEGIGRRLLVDLIDASLAQGYSARISASRRSDQRSWVERLDNSICRSIRLSCARRMVGAHHHAEHRRVVQALGPVRGAGRGEGSGARAGEAHPLPHPAIAIRRLLPSHGCSVQPAFPRTRIDHIHRRHDDLNVRHTSHLRMAEMRNGDKELSLDDQITRGWSAIA